MQDHAHEKREYDRNRSEDPQDGVAPGLDRGPVADDSSEGQKEEEGPVYLHVYAGGPADLESVAHGAACNPSFYENASMGTLPTTEVIPHPRGLVVIPFILRPLLESPRGRTPRKPYARHRRRRPRRHREDPQRGRSRGSGRRDHGPLSPRRPDTPPAARHSRRDLRRGRVRNRRPHAAQGGARRGAGEDFTQLQIRLLLPCSRARDLPLPHLRHDASRAALGRWGPEPILRPGSGGRATHRREAGQVGADGGLVREALGGPDRVRRPRRRRAPASARASRRGAGRGGARLRLEDRVRSGRGDRRDGARGDKARRPAVERARKNGPRAAGRGSPGGRGAVPRTGRDVAGPWTAVEP